MGHNLEQQLIFIPVSGRYQHVFDFFGRDVLRLNMRIPRIGHIHKNELLLEVMTHLNPYLAIVFANTKTTADEIAAYLTDKGMKVGLLHGGLTPRERKKVMADAFNIDSPCSQISGYDIGEFQIADLLHHFFSFPRRKPSVKKSDFHPFVQQV